MEKLSVAGIYLLVRYHSPPLRSPEVYVSLKSPQGGRSAAVIWGKEYEKLEEKIEENVKKKKKRQ
jgi:deoxyribodipyrimidine photolyase